VVEEAAVSRTAHCKSSSLTVRRTAEPSQMYEVLGGVCLLGAGVLGQASMKPSLLKTMARLSESVPEDGRASSPWCRRA
jgi:hypothetical protein